MLSLGAQQSGEAVALLLWTAEQEQLVQVTIGTLLGTPYRYR